MNRFCFMSQFFVDASEQEILFYTQTPPVGAVATTLWKYELSSRELKICFEINRRINIRKYNADEGESGLRYIAISYPGTASVIGLDVQGHILFEYDMDGFVGEPIYDKLGNIYISVGNVWIYCLSKEGKVLWKWRPVSNENRRITEGIRNYWITNEKLYVLAVGQEYLILNMEIWMKYFSIEIQEITLTCETFKEIQIQVLTNEKMWIDGRASSIPYEKREGEDRDRFKECSCRDDIVWIEFCDDCPKEQIATVMEMVCKSMAEKLGVLVKLQML